MSRSKNVSAPKAQRAAMGARAYQMHELRTIIVALKDAPDEARASAEKAYPDEGGAKSISLHHAHTLGHLSSAVVALAARLARALGDEGMARTIEMEEEIARDAERKRNQEKFEAAMALARKVAT